MSRSAMRMTPAQHTRLMTEPNSLSKSYAEYSNKAKIDERLITHQHTESSTSAAALPPYISEPMPQYRMEDRLKFPEDHPRSPTRFSTQRDFKNASEKLDALTRKLSIIHRSLVSSDSAPSSVHAQDNTNSTPTTKPLQQNTVPLLNQPQSALDSNSGYNQLQQQHGGSYNLSSGPCTAVSTQPESELRFCHLEARVKDLQALVMKNLSDGRDETSFQDSVSRGFASMEGRLMDLEATIFSRLHLLETKNQEFLETKIANCENRVMMLDTRVCTAENKNSTIDVNVSARLMAAEDELSVQNQRIDALRRDVDKLIESQALLIKTLAAELRQLRPL